MKKMLLLMGVVISVGLAGCGQQQEPAEASAFDFQGTLIGDAPGVGRLRSLAGIEDVGFTLSTQTPPYGVTFHEVDNTKEELLYASALLFLTIPNVDWIVFDQGDGELEVGRTEIMDFLEGEEFADESQLADFITRKVNADGLPGFIH